MRRPLCAALLLTVLLAGCAAPEAVDAAAAGETAASAQAEEPAAEAYEAEWTGSVGTPATSAGLLGSGWPRISPPRTFSEAAVTVTWRAAAATSGMEFVLTQASGEVLFTKTLVERETTMTFLDSDRALAEANFFRLYAASPGAAAQVHVRVEIATVAPAGEAA